MRPQGRDLCRTCAAFADRRDPDRGEEAWRAGLAEGEDERRAQLATLSGEERRLLAEDLAALASS